MNYFSDKQLEKQLDSIIEFNSLPEVDKDEYDFLSDVLTRSATKIELYEDLCKNLVNWNFNLKLQIDKENYELCGKIREVISIEREEFKRNIENKFGTEEVETSIDLIIELHNFIKFKLNT